jgi:photosystem II stability/assembly factor-like uncharacterized protein
MRDRIRLYLERHGDNGRIDPERRLKGVAADYAGRRAEAARRKLATRGIPGDTWTSIGPTNGAGRVTAIAPHPSTAGTLYVGAAGGGVWKTTDGGVTWAPLTEGINDLSVGALAVAPSSPSTLYLGTGEGGYAGDFIPGIGFLTSSDGGATWSLPNSVIATTFYRILVHPANPQELVIGTNQGGLRSTDGGATWKTVISRAIYGDVADLVRHPTDPMTLYAATWCVNTCTAGVGKVLKSADGGVTWVEKSVGLPDPGGLSSTFLFNERLAIAISATNPLVLYAATGLTNNLGKVVSHIYKTTDGGEMWSDLPAVASNTSRSISRYLSQQPWYDNTIVVSPADPNLVLAGGVGYIRSTDGGNTFAVAPFAGTDIHVDVHDLRYQGATLYVGNDGGVWSSPDDGVTGAEHNAGLVIRQYYALANDPANRSRILAGAQDNGTNQRPDSGGTVWRDVVGGDGFECAVNPAAPTFAYGTVQHGLVYRSKAAGGAGDPGFSDVSPPYASDEATPFSTVLTVHPARPSTVYTGSYRVWKSDNGGDTWLPLPTTTTDSSTWSTTDTITAIVVAPSDPSVLMVGKNRRVFRSTDAGNTWVLASTGLPNLHINNLEMDPKSSSVAYAALATTSDSNVYQTTDGGQSWLPRASGLPHFAAQVVRVDPTDSNTLYCGVDVGVYRSTDQGASWNRFGTGLPSASVHDIRILEDGSILRVATHGRGAWELGVPPTGNTPPSAVISNPAAPVTVAGGTTVTFGGAVSDPDPGDAASGVWTLPDTWESVAAAAGPSSLSHTFNWPGVFPVSLAARDTHGAIGAASVAITVPEQADGCATPIVLPGGGPFPYTVLANSESATADLNDPVPSCGFPPFGSYASLWFEFTPTAAGTYEFSTCGGSVDTVLSVYTGPACGPYTAVTGGCDDDAVGSICDGTLASDVTVPAVAGQTLRIMVTGFLGSDTGTFPVTVASVTAPATTPWTTGLSQRSAASSGGNPVVVYGYNFVPGAAVSFGGAPASDVAVLDPRYLTATAPARPPGLANIVVTAPDQTRGTLAGSFFYTPAAGVGTCVPGPTVLCLNASRFKIEVAWSVPDQGTSGVGHAIPLTTDTGYFWFFNSANVELVVKALDGRVINGYFWIFYGALSNVAYTITVTDTTTGEVKTYTNPSGQFASAGDTGAFFGGSAAVASPFERSPLARDAAAGCVPAGTNLCLNQGRFQVSVAWQDFQGNPGVGQPAPLTPDTGYFWFFNSANVELIVKVLDGRSINGKFWVFYGALSNVPYTVTVKDTLTGAVKTYTNPSGVFASVGDTSAF